MEVTDQLFTQETRQPAKERPVFLTVLCILSFTGNGLVIMGSAFALIWWKFFLPFLQLAMEQDGIHLDNPAIASLWGTRFFEIFDYLPLVYIVTFAAAIFNLYGVVLMWKLKRSGFYIYAVTELLPHLVTIVVFTMVLGGIGFGLSLMNFIIPVAFVIMYGANLKYMR